MTRQPIDYIWAIKTADSRQDREFYLEEYQEVLADRQKWLEETMDKSSALASHVASQYDVRWGVEYDGTKPEIAACDALLRLNGSYSRELRNVHLKCNIVSRLILNRWDRPFPAVRQAASRSVAA